MRLTLNCLGYIQILCGGKYTKKASLWLKVAGAASYCDYAYFQQRATKTFRLKLKGINTGKSLMKSYWIM